MIVQIWLTVLCVIAALVLFVIVQNEFRFCDGVTVGGNILAFFSSFACILAIGWLWWPDWCNEHLMWMLWIFIPLAIVSWIIAIIRFFCFEGM